MQVAVVLRTGLLLCFPQERGLSLLSLTCLSLREFGQLACLEHGKCLVYRLYGEALAEPIVYSPPTMGMIESGKYVNDEDECVSGAHNCDPQANCMNTPGLDSDMSACSSNQRDQIVREPRLCEFQGDNSSEPLLQVFHSATGFLRRVIPVRLQTRL